jgi:hypothetical protein
VNLKKCKRIRKLVRTFVKSGLEPRTLYQMNTRTRVIRVHPDCARGVYLLYKGKLRRV